MENQQLSYEIYLEVGQKKVFAAAVDWPGWTRPGKDQAAAVQALLQAAPRYLPIVKTAGLEFMVPERASQLHVVATLAGTATTDFGAPDAQPASDEDPIGAPELDRYEKLLQACWLAFDQAVALAQGKPLQKGPRGGGRDLVKMDAHVVGAEASYLSALGWKLESIKHETSDQRRERVRREVIRGLRAAAAGQIPREGPRGGKRWPPRYFVRRLAWHVLDHAWEIEDRIL